MYCTVFPSVVALLQILLGVAAQVEPPGFEGSGNPISSRDRIYTGDQTSNTVTVIDPGRSKVLGTISLGDERLGSDLGPQYIQSVNSHGLGFSRDGKYVVSLSVTSNTITVIRTADNTIVSRSWVDRAPHEAFFAPDNQTIWIGTRGVSSVDIIDGFNGSFVGRIFTAAGPSKVLFNGNGTIAYVNHIFDAVISVIDVPSKTVMYNITGLADKFSSDMMISADSKSLWAAHKMTGQVSVIDLAARRVVAVLDTGTETNHPNFAVIDGVNHGFVTVAAINATRVYRQEKPEDVPSLVKTIRMAGIQPHGIWPSPDNTRMYVVNQHSDSVDIIDIKTLEVVDTMRVGQDGQALIYVSDAIPEGSDGMTNLGTQGLNLRVENRLVRVATNQSHIPHKGTPNPFNSNPQALITIRETAGLDMVQLIGRDLVPNGTYTATARCHLCSERQRMSIVTFNASTISKSGCGGAPEVLAFLNFFENFDIETVRVSMIKR